MTMRLPALFLILPLSVPAAAQDGAPSAPYRVEVTGPSADARRRDASVALIVIDRDSVGRHGDGNLAEVLKRQPGISLVGSEVRMRGLGAGYTQILIDGEPAPQGFTVDALPPSLVERIEISRSATADRSTQAVAGSINIILRKRAKNAPREDRAALAYQRGAWSPSVSTQFGARSKTLSWSVNVALERNAAASRIGSDTLVEDADGARLALRRARFERHGHTDRVALAPRLQWELAGGDTLSWQTLVDATHAGSRTQTDEAALFGSATRYPDNRSTLDARSASLRSDVAWTRRIAGGGKLSVKGLFDANRRDADYVFYGTRADGGAGLVRGVEGGASERTFGLSGKYLTPLGQAHSLGIGWDVGRTARDEYRHQFDAYTDGTVQAPRLQDYGAQVERAALFAQDEWDIAQGVQGYLGIRWEGLRTRTDGRGMERVKGSSSVASPIAQLLWKLPDRRQVRLALARTYKAPLTRDLVPRRFTVNNDNSAVLPDFEGNPDLRPESSWGIDLAYERELGKDGQASLSAYYRRVSDVMSQRLFRDGESWVSTPINDGNAIVAGLEFDFKTSMPAAAGRVDLRLNASRNWSKLERVEGPYNRLAEQVPLSVNAGIDYRAASGWTIGGNLNFQGSGTSVTSSGAQAYRGARALADLFWARAIKDGWRLRVSVTNALGRDEVIGRGYQDAAGGSHSRSVGEGFPTLRLAVERAR